MTRPDDASLTLADDRAALVEKMALAVEDARKYYVEGSGKFGREAPFFLVDSSSAEPEVNWLGDLIAEFSTKEEAENARKNLVATAALAAYDAHMAECGMVSVTRGELYRLKDKLLQIKQSQDRTLEIIERRIAAAATAQKEPQNG